MGVTVSSVSETVQEPLHSFVRRKATKRPKDGSFGKVCRKVLDDPGHIVTMWSPPPKKNQLIHSELPAKYITYATVATSVHLLELDE